MNLLLKYILLIGFSSISLNTSGQLLTPDSKKVKINLGWSHQFQFAGYYAAIEQGFFTDEGLDVELYADLVADNIGNIIDEKYDFGVLTGGLLLQDNRYEDLAIIAAIYQQSPVSLLTLNNGNIKSLKDVEGKDIIGGTEIKSMLISAGVDIEKVNFHGTLSNFSGLINGDIDGSSFFITDQAMFIGTDSLKFRIWRPIEYGIQFYGDCLYTNRRLARTSPEVVEKVKRAVIRGWQYAVNHPDDMIDLIISQYNSNLDREVLNNEANIIIHTLILPQFYDIGDMQLSRWNEMARLIYEFGLIDQPRNLKDFIFDADKALSRPIKIFIWVAILLILIAAAIVLIQFLYNRQLRKAVDARTSSLKKTNEELDRFVYSISHDIRSPLSSVQGLINVMKIEPQQNEMYLGLIETSIRKLDNYTRDILDYTRNSRTKIEPTAINIAEIVDKCISAVKYMDDGEHIIYDKNIDVSADFHTDPWRLEVILTNLIGNSIKYRDPTKDKQQVSIEANMKNSILNITVEDNGIGMESIHLDKIFNMFYRASEESQGSGMGLFIVKETVGLLGGRINIESAKTKGTTVHLTIPEKSVG